MFTIFHVEDWLLNARKASKFLSMRLGMDANKMTHVGNNVGPELHKSLVKVIDELKVENNNTGKKGLPFLFSTFLSQSNHLPNVDLFVVLSKGQRGCGPSGDARQGVRAAPLLSEGMRR